MSRLTLSARRCVSVLSALLLTLGTLAAITLSSSAAQAATCNNGYSGGWEAGDPNGRLVVVSIVFTDCNRLDSGQVYAVSKPGYGLPSADSDGLSYWGRASTVTWGYLGTSLTATFRFYGVTETLYIEYPLKYAGLPVTQTEQVVGSTSRQLPVQYFRHA